MISQLRSLASSVIRSKLFIQPRLGRLNQYAGRPLNSGKPTPPPDLDTYPLLSIVTPSFSQGDYIKHTMDSVLQQAYPNLEYFVQDGGSDDETVNILEQYENRLSGWRSEKDSGQSQAINRAFSHTSGEIMAWLNSDDLLLPGALNTIVKYFNNHPEVDVVYGDRLIIDKESMEVGRWILPGHDEMVMSWVDYIPQESLFWRRSIWEKSGARIDETFSFAMDWDLLIRFRDAGANFAHISRFLGAFRVHEHQKTSSIIDDKGMEEMSRIRERVHGYVPEDSQIKRKVLPFLVKHLVRDLGYRIKVRIAGWF